MLARDETFDHPSDTPLLLDIDERFELHRREGGEQERRKLLGVLGARRYWFRDRCGRVRSVQWDQSNPATDSGGTVEKGIDLSPTMSGYARDRYKAMHT
jgi:hypothetical protein